jgi:phosphoribosylamine--glycine ligase
MNNILILGKGAREHAVVERLKRENVFNKVFVYPGNDGIFFKNADSVTDIEAYENEFENIKKFCLKNDVNYVFPCDEKYLAEGIKNFLGKEIKVIGPDKNSALLESDKIFSKNFMYKYGIKTPEYEILSKKEILTKKNMNFPKVLKYRGLYAGKGVKICFNRKDMEVFLKKFEDEEKFLVENYINGYELSVFCRVDYNGISPFFIAKDFKKIYDGDLGDNTGGMGSLSIRIDKILKKNIENMIEKTFYGMKKEKMLYKGMLYLGLSVYKNTVYVFEYNVRLGDPETQVMLNSLSGNFGNFLLKGEKIYNDKNSACVVFCSRGYPGDYEKNIKLFDCKFLEEIEKSGLNIYFSGVKLKNNVFYTNGGRVFSLVCNKHENNEKNLDEIYEFVNKNSFLKRLHFRKDLKKYLKN